MRIVWKDSAVSQNKKPIKYRKHYIYGYGEGWITDVPGDDNIYHSNYCALNAIDKALGKPKTEPCEKRKKCGIKIIGRKEHETA